MKEQLLENTEFITGMFQSLSNSIKSAFPIFLSAFVLLVIGWVLAKSISSIIRRILEKTKIDDLAEKINLGEVTGTATSFKISKILSKILYWVILLIFFVATAEQLGLQIVVDQLTMIINYIPQLLVAVFIFAIGVYIATFIRDTIKTATSSMGMSSGKLISSVVFYFLLIILTITALEQAGIDTALISSNLMLIIGAILFSGAIAYGFAARDIMTNILSTFYAKKNFKAGQKIKVGDIEGIIIEIDSTYVKLLSEEKKLILPSRMFVEERVVIIEDVEEQNEEV